MDFYCKRLPVHIVLEQAADIMAWVFKVPPFCYFSGSYFYFVHLLVNVCFKVQKRKKKTTIICLSRPLLQHLYSSSVWTLCFSAYLLWLVSSHRPEQAQHNVFTHTFCWWFFSYTGGIKEDFNCTEYCDITTLQFLTILFKGTDSN